MMTVMIAFGGWCRFYWGQSPNIGQILGGKAFTELKGKWGMEKIWFSFPERDQVWFRHGWWEKMCFVWLVAVRAAPGCFSWCKSQTMGTNSKNTLGKGAIAKEKVGQKNVWEFVPLRGGGRTPNGKCHLKFPFRFFLHPSLTCNRTPKTWKTSTIRAIKGLVGWLGTIRGLGD